MLASGDALRSPPIGVPWTIVYWLLKKRNTQHQTGPHGVAVSVPKVLQRSRCYRLRGKYSKLAPLHEALKDNAATQIAGHIVNHTNKSPDTAIISHAAAYSSYIFSIEGTSRRLFEPKDLANAAKKKIIWSKSIGFTK